jgi:uncharacterized repeat protein (TIGR01451 family)
MPNLHRFTGVLAVLAAFTGLTQPVGAQQSSCSAQGTVSTPLRGEGFTEQTGDIIITCIGGATIAPGNAIPSITIDVFYSTTVTSRLLPTAGDSATNYISEALLLIDEPGTFGLSYGSTLPPKLCATPLRGCAAWVGAVPGPTLGTAVSSGSTPAPNVYQGVVSGNRLTFSGIPYLPPGVTDSRIFRITNVRVNAQSLAGGGIAPVYSFVEISGAAAPPLANTTPIVGYVSDGLSAGVSNAANLSQCSSQTKISAATLTFSELFGSAFKTRVAALSNTPYAGQLGNPTQQNIPGSIYNSESGFVLPIPGSSPPQVAGLADFGTRLKATFNNIPAGAHLFVSTTNVSNNASQAAVPSPIGGSQANSNLVPPYVGFAQLVNSESVSDGDAATPGIFPAVAATDYGPNGGSVPIAEVYLSNGTGSAVWEVVNTNPNTTESFKFAVYITYTSADAQNIPLPGTSTVNLSFAPTALSGSAADAGTPLPRFSGYGTPYALFTVQACTAASSLSIAKTHSGNFTQGQNGATYTLTVSNATGAGPTAGTVTVTETVPTGMTLASMAGTGWTCPGTAPNNCTRSSALSGGASYPPITVTVDVASNAATPLSNSVSVSGGGSAGSSTSDSTTILPNFPVLSIGKSHTGSFAQGQNGAMYTVTVSNSAGAAPTSGTVTVTETVPSGMTLVSMAGPGWTCPGTAANNCTRSNALAGGTSYPAIVVTVNVASDASSQLTNQVSVSGGGSGPASIGDLTLVVGSPLRFVPVTPCRIADTRNPTGPFGGPILGAAISRDFNIPASACGIPTNAMAYSLNLTVVPVGPLGYLSVWPAGQSQPLVSTLNSLDGRVKANAAIVPVGANGAITLYASDSTHAIIDINGYFVPASGVQNLAFYPVTPCRVADTRNPTGIFGGPALAPGVARTFAVPASTCGIPASAQAYAFNMTVVPSGSLGFLATWPAGSPQPTVSTLNALTGVITSNAAIVPAGVSGGITVYATNTTDLIVDINGYFAPPGTGSLDFYTATPCRVLDTRNPAGPLGGPIMGAAESRSFPVPSSTCGIPSTAKAYSLNATVVPTGSLSFLTLWGSGSMPFVSTLNATDGAIVANAALVPAGVSGAVTAYTTNLSHLILDINGYFQ